MIDFREIAEGGDDWEAFSRDLLVALGFAIDIPPNRGADGGKDLIVVEHLGGKLSRYPFRWLVSCKHKAHSGRSVTEADEPNIVDRMTSYACDGFLGIYSTLPSAGLAERLRGLRNERTLRDYRILDARLIENYLVRLGYSRLVMRYFPAAYAKLKPLHAIAGQYVDLNCKVCGRDLLEPVGLEDYVALVGRVTGASEDGRFRRVIDVYWACKGPCNDSLERGFLSQGYPVGWEDISDLVIPAWYLRYVFTLMNRLRDGDDIYENESFEQMKTFLTALGQKVFRELTEEERDRVKDLFTIPMI
jgi:hypothetical protein